MKTLHTMSFAFLALLLGSVLSTCGGQPAIVGGPCTYDDHPGSATITRIEKTEASKQQSETTGYEGFEVRFTFKPDAPLKDDLGARAATWEHSFQIGSGTYPGPEYLAKYKLEAGKTFRGTMSVIQSGTCTPVIVKLEGVDPADFFEGKK
ncbi:MAG TPA: hypothetical protein DIT13_17320 [Verrucomicrobiales bacterium]|nr:hypothetical protein [Verrucomicrobiales bacterium]HRJ08409.1 hypothetical protein [Prosthecobacter sp.]HRK15136.1 hypothetical protein [Prosthecobacter sp.]